MNRSAASPKRQQAIYLTCCLALLTIVICLSGKLQSSEGQGEPPAIHLIIVGDTLTTELGVENDLKRWCREFYEIKNNTGIVPSIVLLASETETLKDRAQSIQDLTGTQVLKIDTSVQEVLNQCDQLSINSDDAVVFYYGGHGFRTDQVQGKWPAMQLHQMQDGRKRRAGLPLKQVFDKLSAKNPRLLLVIADCCNDWLPVEIAPPLAYAYEGLVNHEKFYKKLYLDSRGHYLASGCKEGQKSRSNSDVGGFFTNSFFSQVEKDTIYIEDSPYIVEPTWDSIFTAISADKIWVSEFDTTDFQQAQWQKIK